jgi:hypothetical protein
MKLGNLAIVAGLAVLIGGIVIIIVSVLSGYNTSKTEDCTIVRHDTITKVSNGNSSTEKRITTSDCGVFTVNDSAMKGSWRSADLYGKIQDGHRYTLTVNGWRSGFFSTFPNITKAVEVK